jgi:hypothetical protein
MSGVSGAPCLTSLVIDPLCACTSWNRSRGLSVPHFRLCLPWSVAYATGEAPAFHEVRATGVGKSVHHPFAQLLHSAVVPDCPVGYNAISERFAGVTPFEEGANSLPGRLGPLHLPNHSAIAIDEGDFVEEANVREHHHIRAVLCRFVQGVLGELDPVVGVRALAAEFRAPPLETEAELRFVPVDEIERDAAGLGELTFERIGERDAFNQSLVVPGEELINRVLSGLQLSAKADYDGALGHPPNFSRGGANCSSTQGFPGTG